MKAMDRTELAWAAGFWDGEGSAWLTAPADRTTRYPHARINQADVNGTPYVLERFQRALALGRIQGPEIEEGREPLYRWVVSSRPDVARTYDLLRPWLGEVKALQFEHVLGVPSGRPPTQCARDEEIAWAAGLWDGEGCVSIMDHRTHEGYFILEASITQSSPKSVPEVLERFRSIVGAGRIYGPYDAGPERQPIYRWKLVRTEGIKAVIAQLEGQIGPVKSMQAASRLAIVLAQPTLPRGDPAWGNRKTRCSRGHEYATARIRPFRSRGVNTEAPRASKQCLTCVREDARERRIERRTAATPRRRL